jgi:hypothetical protein
MTEFEATKVAHGKADGLACGLDMLRDGADPERMRRWEPAGAPASPAEGRPGEWHYIEGFVIGVRQAADTARVPA